MSEHVVVVAHLDLGKQPLQIGDRQLAQRGAIPRILMGGEITHPVRIIFGVHHHQLVGEIVE
jgi:hypothetical protein